MELKPVGTIMYTSELNRRYGGELAFMRKKGMVARKLNAIRGISSKPVLQPTTPKVLCVDVFTSLRTFVTSY